MKTAFTLLILLVTTIAQANAQIFYCGLTDQEPKKQIYFEIEDGAIESGIGTIMVSKMAHTDQAWQVVERAQVQAGIDWQQVNGNLEIVGLDVDMGKSGHLTVQKNEAGSFVKATLMSLNFPDGIQFSYCHYNSGGPKPGMTGSN